jgi:hypothetical protein
MQLKGADTWNPQFFPCFTPMEMLDKGVFMDSHYNTAIKGLPGEWYRHKNVIPRSKEPDVKDNYYGVKSRQSLKVWQQNSWTTKDSPLGWWEWYVKYYLGRRIEKEDTWQIGRWRSFVARHMGQIKANCQLDNKECRPVQRQALLQWAWDSSKVFDEDRQKKNLQKLGISLKRLNVAEESHIIITSPFNDWGD